jgi:hypothetical protein
MLKQICALALAVLASACINSADMSAIEAQVAQFYERQTAGEDSAIYEDAAPAFRGGATFADVQRLNTTIRALGCEQAVRDPNQWHNNMSTNGHFITVTYNRTCASGAITETFVFEVTPTGPQLLNYNANGDAFSNAPPQASQPEGTPDKPTEPGQTPIPTNTPPGTRT